MEVLHESSFNLPVKKYRALSLWVLLLKVEALINYLDLIKKFMAKFRNPSKLSKEEQEELLIQFCRAICQLRNPIEVAQFLKDLISAQEAEMLAKRLKIAELLISGKHTYVQIAQDFKVGQGTIARVHEWLRNSGDGYKLVLSRLPKEESDDSLEESFDPLSWRNMKRKYPLYYWPQLLLENIIKTAKANDRRKLKAVLHEMDKKSALYKQLNKLLAQSNFIVKRESGIKRGIDKQG